MKTPKTLKKLLKRFAEPSTWAGMAVIVMALGVHEAQWAAYSVAGIAVAKAGLAIMGAVAMWKKEK